MLGCHFPFCLNNPELCAFWSGPCLSQVTFADGDPHVWGTQLSPSFPYGQAGIRALCVNQEASLQQVEIWPYWIYCEGQGLLPPQECQPGGGSGGALCSTWHFHVQLHALCLERKIRKTIHRLVCFDSEIFLLTCFGPRVPREVDTSLVWKAASGGTSRALEQLDHSTGSERCGRCSSQMDRAYLERTNTFSASSPRLLLWLCQCCSGIVERTVLPPQKKRSE